MEAFKDLGAFLIRFRKAMSDVTKPEHPYATAATNHQLSSAWS